MVILVTRQRGIKVADGTEVPDQMTLKERDDPGLSRGLRESQRSLPGEVGGRKVSAGVIREKSRTGHCRLPRQKGPRIKECGHIEKLEKARSQISPGGTQPRQRLGSSLLRPMLNS